MDRMQKIVTALVAETREANPAENIPAGKLAGVKPCLGVSDISGDGDVLVFFQEDEDVLVTDNSHQTRTIRVRLVALSARADRSKEIAKAAESILTYAENIRVFDRSGLQVSLEEELPGTEGMYITTFWADVR